MIFGNENISTYTRLNMAIWLLLAFQAGFMNIGGYLGVHSFVSHVTGTDTLIGFQLGSGHALRALELLTAPIFFLAGAMLSGVLVDLRLKLRKKPKYYIVFGVLFLLNIIIVVGGFNKAFGEFGSPLTSASGYLLIMLLSFTCGVQNGTITLVSKSVVRTTHMTGLTTDLGIGLVRVLNRDRIDVEDEVMATFMRAGIITFFITGAAVGIMLFHDWKYRGFLLPCVISGSLFAATLYFQKIRRHPHVN